MGICDEEEIGDTGCLIRVGAGAQRWTRSYTGETERNQQLQGSGECCQATLLVPTAQVEYEV